MNRNGILYCIFFAVLWAVLWSYFFIFFPLSLKNSYQRHHAREDKIEYIETNSNDPNCITSTFWDKHSHEIALGTIVTFGLLF